MAFISLTFIVILIKISESVTNCYYYNTYQATAQASAFASATSHHTIRSDKYLPVPPGARPSCASSDDTYCDDDVDDYPTEQIWRLLAIRPEYELLFASDTSHEPPSETSFRRTPKPKPPVLVTPANTSLAFPTYAGNYMPYRYFRRYKRQLGKRNKLCNTQSQFTAPKVAANKKGDWKYVVNLTGPKYQQLVKIEKCTSKVCNGVCSLPEGYKSECKQQYVQKKLAALEGTGQKIYTDLFWFPHCCICEVIQTFG